MRALLATYLALSLGPAVDQNPIDPPMPAPAMPGAAYLESQYAGVILAGRYARGSKEWEDRDREWTDGDGDEPYPDELREVDGHGYEDSCDAAKGCC